MGLHPRASRYGKGTLLLLSIAVSALLVAGCGNKSVASVNGQALSEAEFYELCETATQVNPQRGTVGIQVLSQWISNAVLEQEAKRLKVYPTEEELNKRIEVFRRQAALMDSTLEEQLKQRGMSMETLKRDILNAMLSENVLLRDVTVSEDEVKKAWEDQKDMFVEPEMVRISQITVDNPADLKKAQADLNGNAPFEVVARTYSKDQLKDAGGKVPEPLPLEVPPGLPVAPEAVKAAFKLKPGQISDPVKVGSTWVFVRLDEKIAEKQPNPDDYMDLLRVQLRQQKAQSSGKIQENQQALMQAQQQAKVEIQRDEYKSLLNQNPAGAPAGPAGAGAPPPAPGG